MTYDIQKANMWKRMSAYLFDLIMLVIVAVGFAFLFSVILQYDEHAAEREQLRKSYEEQYGIVFDITQDEYNAMSEEKQAAYNDAYNAFSTDPQVNAKDLLLINLTMIIVAFGILIAYLLLELLVPLLFKNGQTLGKKVFGIAVVRVDCVRISTFQLFVRTVLGKYTIETMIPVFLILLFLFNIMPLVSVVGIALLLILQLGMLIITRLHTPIHDMIAGTATVDMASQLIFDTPEDLIAYKKKLHADAAQKSEYK